MRGRRAEGVLLGLACGDALGRPVEYVPPDRIVAEYGTLTEMVGDGTRGRPPGTVTDDTDQALVLARSLVECDGFDPADVADRLVEWYDGDPVGVDSTTAAAVRRLRRGERWDEAGRRVWEARPEGNDAGSGSLTRCLPLAVARFRHPPELVERSRQVSALTHADPRCTWGCAVLTCTVAGLLAGRPDPLGRTLEAVEPDAPAELVEALRPVAGGEDRDSLPTSGYVLDTLRTGLADGLGADGVESAVVTAVNRGGRTSSTGALAGAVAGARVGADAVPARWLDAVAATDEVRDLTAALRAVPV